MGGLSTEREVSISTGNSVCEAMTRMKLNVSPIHVDQNVVDNLHGVDLAFNALHGTYGEDGSIQGLLEYLNIPYTGSGVVGSALAYDKLKTKEILKIDNEKISRPFILNKNLFIIKNNAIIKLN